MGRENNDTPNNLFRKSPPPLSVPGAHPSEGFDLEFGRVTQSGKANDKVSGVSFSKKDCPSSKNGGFTEHSNGDSPVSVSIAPMVVPLESKSCNQYQKSLVIPVVLVSLIAVLAVLIPVSVILRRDQAQLPNVQYTPTPRPVKPNMTLEELHDLVPNLTEATLERIVTDPYSPQAMALTWCQEDPGSWTSYEDWRKVQRFALAVLFYAMGGVGWHYGYDAYWIEWLRQDLHECDWMRYGRRFSSNVICNEENRFFKWQFHDMTYVRGTLPPEIGLLTHLEMIDLSKCTVGKSLSNLFSALEDRQDFSHYLPALQTLNLTDAQLTGSVPTSLATLTSLKHLDLTINHLEHAVPSELGLLTNLETLALASNWLTGSIPSQLGNLPLLQTFSVEDNSVDKGVLPESLCSEDHFPMIALTTEWCQSQEQCCSNS